MDPRFSAARAAIIIAGGVMLLAATSTADAQRRDPRRRRGRPEAAARPDAGHGGPDRPRRHARPPRPAATIAGREIACNRHRTPCSYVPPTTATDSATTRRSYDANGRPLYGELRAPAALRRLRLHARPERQPVRGEQRGDDGGRFRQRRPARLPVLRGDRRPARPAGPSAHDLLSVAGRLDDPAPGQRGRVRGEPPTGTAACYAIDSVGRMVLRY